MQPRFIDDLARLETHAYSHRSLTWWGLLGMFAIEATAFGLAAACYLYLMNQEPQWPPAAAPPPLLMSTVLTVALILTAFPNQWLKKQSEKENLKAVQIGLVLVTALELGILVLRYFEFTALNVSWRDNAYGSILYAVLTLHTVHLITDFIDSCVLVALMFTRHAQGRRFVDVSENALYWHYVVFTWPPLYVLLYFVPRWTP